jgi:tetratricopeptide (TPR) repeat protein
MNHAPGDKPVINEKIKTRSGEKAAGRRKDTPAEKIEKKTADDSGLKEGVRLFHLKRWEGALRELLLVNADDLSGEQRAELAYYLGLCCAKLERFDEALLYLDQVVTAGGNLLRVYQCRMTLAYIYVKTGRAKMAEFELKRLRKSGFESPPIYNTLAYAAYTQKRYHDAVEYYEKSLELDKNNTTALNSMGYILADTGLDSAKGLRYCLKAVEHRPKNAAYLDSLGWAYYKCGKLSEARNLLRKAIDLAPREKEIREHYRIVTGRAV